MIEQLLSLSPMVRYVAILRDGTLATRSKPTTSNASAAESDRYEETIVNPTLLQLTQARGDIDCGGLNYVVVRYGNFFQVVQPTSWGHVSVCVEPAGDPVAIAGAVANVVRNNDAARDASP